MVLDPLLITLDMQPTVGMCSPAAYALWYLSPSPALRGFTLAPGRILKGKRKERADAGCKLRGYGVGEDPTAVR